MISRYSFRFAVGLSMVAVFLVIATATVVMGLIFYQGKAVVEKDAGRYFQQVAEGVADKTRQQLEEALNLASETASVGSLNQKVGADLTQHPATGFFTQTLGNRPNLYSLYIGYTNGDFFQVIAARNLPAILDRHQAPSNTAMILRGITGEGEGREQSWTFVDAAGLVLGAMIEPEPPAYDPRQRPWYGAATAAPDAAQLSEAYVFNSLQAPGITASKVTASGAVVGVDITLSGLSDYIASLSLSPGTETLILDDQNRVLAGGGPQANALEPLVAIEPSSSGDDLQRLLATRAIDIVRSELAGADAYAMSRMAHQHDDKEWSIVIAGPVADFTGHLSDTILLAFMVSGLMVLVSLPFVIWGAHRMSASLARLEEDAIRIKNWDFSGDEKPVTWIREIETLSDAFAMMKASLVSRTRRLEKSQDDLYELIQLGLAISDERNLDTMMTLVLRTALRAANAEGGTIYLVDDSNRLVYSSVRNDKLNLQMDPDEAGAFFEPIPLFNADGSPNLANVAAATYHRDSVLVFDDVYEAEDFDFAGPRKFDEAHEGYRTKSMLTVPMKTLNGTIIGVLQLVNCYNPLKMDEIKPFDPNMERQVSALVVQASLSINNLMLIKSLQELLDSFIRLIADAIDAKSPYTGGHCARVPELAFMLAHAAEDQQVGPFGDFAFANQEEWREFEIGAWLHDCGKITTPEYVIDKATKLETIYNRIHEVRMRYEVLIRDARIEMLEAIASGTDETEAMTAFDAKVAAYSDDFAFVAECNIGGEYMDPEKVERLERISQTPWTRTLDDRLGLSHGELDRLKDVPAKPLPATEMLLADKPDHIILRPVEASHMHKQKGFNIPIPDHYFNQGELKNLCVSRGTLTDEERFIINDHIVQTIVMLEHLPLPPHMKRVPEYAGTHHETMTGTGYPRGLTGDQLSIPARIMVVADIFEALTAADRPYKTPKPLSVAVDILAGFAERDHIDREVFVLFLTSGVYRDYANRFLDPSQIDDVDIKPYVEKYGGGS